MSLLVCLSIKVLLFLGVVVPVLSLPTPKDKADLHTIFLTECSLYFEWQSLGVVYSIKRSGHLGPVTRVMCCTKEQLKKLSTEFLELMPTHIAPSYTVHPVSGDVYSAYNKPMAVIDYLEKKWDVIKQSYVMVMDADMLVRLPLIPSEMGVKGGTATGAYFGYLKGVTNDLAKRHIGHVKPREDSEGGQPRGRRADQIGGFIVMDKHDLKKMSKDWLKFTENVRADPHAWNESGDVYSTHPGDKPWISEMYGYVFAAANNDIWHKPDRTSMLYPEYLPSEPPRILHYGLYFKIEDYEFDKHWYYNFDALACGPWDFSAKKPRNGLFPHPPRPTALKSYALKSKPQMGLEYLRDLFGVETIVTLNNAFCEHLLETCPQSDELESECEIAKNMEEELLREYRDLDAIPSGSPGSWCVDTHEKCGSWAESGQCEDNPGYMRLYCKVSCNACRSLLPPILKKAGVNATQSGSMGNEVNRRIIDLKKEMGATPQQKQVLRHKCLTASLTAAEVAGCVKAADVGQSYFKNKGGKNVVQPPNRPQKQKPEIVEETTKGGQNLDKMIEQIQRQEEALQKVSQNSRTTQAWKTAEGFVVWILVMAAVLVAVSKSQKTTKLHSRTQ